MLLKIKEAIFLKIFISLLGSSDLLDEVLQVERVGSFDGHAEGTGPDLGTHNTEGTGNTEENGVVVVLGEAVVHQKGT